MYARLWCRFTTGDSECLECEVESLGEGIQTFRSLPSSQARDFCLEMVASRFFGLSGTVHSVATQKSIIPNKTAVSISVIAFCVIHDF